MRKTAVFRNDLFLRHDTGPSHPESPDRLRVIYDVLDSANFESPLVFPKFSTVSHETISQNHSSSLIDRVASTAGSSYNALDADTTTSADSYDAACLAVGAVVTGVDLLMDKEIDNGFAIVRPPGHHAEKDRAMGFCLFNNVAIAARHAMAHHGLERIMIIDWDLHHGNGTQNSFYETEKVLYLSSHQYPHYPGTGGLHEVGRGAGEGYTVNIPMGGGQGDLEYATLFKEIVEPIGLEYKPQLILLSAGFDIYQGDPLGAMRVTHEGFGYMTRVLTRLAETVCDGRLLVTLEGGYNLTGMRDGALAVLSELAGVELPTDFSSSISERSGDLFQTERSDDGAINNAKNVAQRYWNI